MNDAGIGGLLQYWSTAIRSSEMLELLIGFALTAPVVFGLLWVAFRIADRFVDPIDRSQAAK